MKLARDVARPRVLALDVVPPPGLAFSGRGRTLGEARLGRGPPPGVARLGRGPALGVARPGLSPAPGCGFPLDVVPPLDAAHPGCGPAWT